MLELAPLNEEAQKKAPLHQLKNIKTKHRQMMYMIVSGMSNNEIAENLNMSQSRISIIRHSPLFMRELEKIETKLEAEVIKKQADINVRVKQLQNKALDTLEDMITPTTELGKKTPIALKRGAANDILNLGELRRTTALNDANKNGGGGLNGNQFAAVLEAAYEIAERKKVIDEKRIKVEKEKANSIETEVTSVK